MLKTLALCIYRPMALLERIPTLYFQAGLLGAVFGVLFLSVTAFDQFPISYLNYSDKFNHMAAFFTLSMLTKGALPKAKITTRWGLLCGYGILIELIQSVLPRRSATSLDFVADVLGILLFELLLKLYKITKEYTQKHNL